MVSGFARPSAVHFLPDDQAAVDRALVAGRTLVEVGDSDAGPRRGPGRRQPAAGAGRDLIVSKAGRRRSLRQARPDGRTFPCGNSMTWSRRPPRWRRACSTPADGVRRPCRRCWVPWSPRCCPGCRGSSWRCSARCAVRSARPCCPPVRRPTCWSARCGSAPSLVRFYLDLMPGLDRMHRNGVDALCDVATVLHLERWIQPAVADETMRPLRQLVGPEEELGFGPAYDEVLDVLHGIADFTGSSPPRPGRDAGVGQSRPSSTGTGSPTPSSPPRASPAASPRCGWSPGSPRSRARPYGAARVFRATRLRAAAVILADVSTRTSWVAASEPWLAGVSRRPAAGLSRLR